MEKLNLISGLLLVALMACNSKASQSKSIPAIPEQPNENYANVFKPLDGTWQGIFYVYTDQNGQQKKGAMPMEIDANYLDQLDLAVSTKLKVQQIYKSTSPYHQEVNITDTYTNENGETKIVESTGINKVENGRLWCIVNKPDETIKHVGRTEGTNTIIWQRDIRSPLKVEYFKETVEANTYSIIGWGYYGEDDPSKSPRTYFKSVYTRVEK